MKHSNAPWFITKPDITVQSFGFGYRIENKTSMNYLASVNGIAENETCKANAKLMAAAPELLKALSDIIESVDNDLGEFKGVNKESLYIKFAKQALKKATEND